MLLPTNHFKRSIPILAAAISANCLAQNTDWSAYLGDNASAQYSPVDQITPENVDRLEVAWTFDASQFPSENQSVLECNPLIIDGILYGTGANKMLFALDASNGELIWRFDPYEVFYDDNAQYVRRSRVNRGVNFWSDEHDSRIFYVSENFLHAIDAKTGKSDESFGVEGYIDLTLGLGRDVSGLIYTSTSPGVVYGDLLILGSAVSESIPAAPGHIRAFDVRTGKQVWRFNTIPHPGEYGYDTWPKEAYKTLGGANAWAGLALDEERGLVYCPTGSATFDFYGGYRHGENLYANSLVCLDAKTGERIWHYQIVRHDLLDLDLPMPPNLFTMRRNGEAIPAVAQMTKSGHIFIFNRVTGEPLFPIEDIATPPSDVPGEQAWPTQPRPTKPDPFVRVHFTEDEITDISPEAHQEILAQYQTLLPHEPFRPGSHLRDTIVLPAMWGGGEWGGAATDPNGVLYFNANEMPGILTLIDTHATSGSAGKTLYQQNCIACHGPDLKGGNAFGQVVPSLIGLSERKSSLEIEAFIKNGSSIMPPFRHLKGSDVYQIMRYLNAPEQTDEQRKVDAAADPSAVRFLHTGNRQWLDSKGYPAIKPPWGTMNALDLSTGEYLWKSAFGEYPELIEQGLPPTGRLSWGGPATTAGGVLFIGANLDGYIRAYDMKTGEEIWRTRPPAAAFATPSVYAVDGRPYIVFACGGGRDTPAGDYYIAYALPMSN